MNDKEKYVCLNCYNVDALDEHLRCQKCNSDVVVSAETVQSMSPLTPSARPSQTTKTIQRKYYHIVVDVFESFVCDHHASNHEEAIAFACSRMYEWYVREGINTSEDILTASEGACIHVNVVDHATFNTWLKKHWQEPFEPTDSLAVSLKESTPSNGVN